MPENQEKRFPTAAALAMSRAAKRLAGKNGDLGLARWAKALGHEASSAIRMKQSRLSDLPPKS